MTLLRKQKEALRLDTYIQFSVGPTRPQSNVASIGYNVHVFSYEHISYFTNLFVVGVTKTSLSLLCFTWQTAAA